MELQAKENELKRKEQELKRREDAIARTGVVIEEKNWPEFFPLIHHDIPNEIPIHLQKIQYVAFTTLLGLVGCLLWNIVAVTVAWIKGEGYCFYLNDQIRNVNSSDHVESSDVFCFVIRSHYMASLNNLLPCWGTWSVRLMVPSSLPSYKN
jgi:hypothetical protein